MKLFNKKRILIIGSLLIATTLGSSCSAFFGDDGYLITSTSTSLNENGDTVLTINFSGEEQKPLTITIPKGVSGKDGVGIASITPAIQGDKVKITIKYTDATVQDTVIEVPVVQGKDGKGIQEVNVGKDELGNTTIEFFYTDGTKGDLITIPKGIDGNGIVSILPTKRDEVTKTSTYEITFTNGEKTTFVVKDGKDGISILEITYSESDSNDFEYALKVTYSDGYTNIIKLPKPQANTWHNGTNDNPPSELGKNGDFYLNIVNGNVYLKENGGWSFRFSIKGVDTTKVETGVVVFNYIDNEGKEQMEFASGVIGKTIEIEKIPVLNNDRKKFLGWYSTKQDDPYAVNAGKFSNLTVLTADVLQVYAWRE